MSGNIGSLPLPGRQTLLFGNVKRLCAGLKRRFSGLSLLERMARQIPPCANPSAYAEACLAALDVRVICAPEALAKIPARGPLILYADHPSGALEGLIMAARCGRVRPDLKILANDVLSVLPQLRPMLLPLDLSGRGKNRNAAVLREAQRHVRNGGALGVFPAGEVARWRLGRGPVEQPWPSLLGRLSGCADDRELRLLALHFTVRVSALFLAASCCSREWAAALLPRTLCGQRHSHARLDVGAPLAAKTLAALNAEERARCLRFCRDALSDRERPLPAVRREPLAEPCPSETFAAALAALPPDRRLAGDGRYSVWLLRGAESLPLLHELARRREEAFRELGEGSGKARDLDTYDLAYEHLLLVHDASRSLAGAYRARLVQPEAARACTKSNLYTASLFRFKPEFFRRCGNALELGRAFVSREHQRDYAPLLLLWKGIGQLALLYGVRTLFGPCSIGLGYRARSVDLLWRHLRLRHWHAPLAALVSGRRARVLAEELPFAKALEYADVNALVRVLENGRGLPILIKQHLQLGGRIAAFHEDRNFGTLDALMVVNLLNAPDKLLRRYMGEDGLTRLRDRMWYT